MIWYSPMKAKGTERFSDIVFGSLVGCFRVLYKLVNCVSSTSFSLLFRSTTSLSTCFSGDPLWFSFSCNNQYEATIQKCDICKVKQVLS